jgi:hypothetical protein
MLKAALPAEERAISLYERVFPMSRYNSPGANLRRIQILCCSAPWVLFSAR